MGQASCLGYDYDKEKKRLLINEEEVKIVRYIFNRYTDGIGCFVLARGLTEKGYKTKKGNTTWSDSSVRGIIKNEKYVNERTVFKTILTVLGLPLGFSEAKFIILLGKGSCIHATNIAILFLLTADEDLINDMTFKAIINSVLINRYGAEMKDSQIY